VIFQAIGNNTCGTLTTLRACPDRTGTSESEFFFHSLSESARSVTHRIFHRERAPFDKGRGDDSFPLPFVESLCGSE
jgi:hypothetical protein